MTFLNFCILKMLRERSYQSEKNLTYTSRITHKWRWIFQLETELEWRSRWRMRLLLTRTGVNGWCSAAGSNPHVQPARGRFHLSDTYDSPSGKCKCTLFQWIITSLDRIHQISRSIFHVVVRPDQIIQMLQILGIKLISLKEKAMYDSLFLFLKWGFFIFWDIFF